MTLSTPASRLPVGSRLVLGLLAALSLSFPSVALAQDDVEELDGRASLDPGLGRGSGEVAEAPPEDIEDDDEPPPPDVPPAEDRRSGHVLAGVGGFLSLPFGSIESGVYSNDLLSSGWGLDAQLAYGVHRNLAVGVWGQWSSFGGDDPDCTSCKLSSYALGASASYFLVQGLRFDPYATAGLGYRSSKLELGDSSVTYGGVVAHLMLGGDWMLAKQLGLGPFLGFDITRNISRSDDETPNSTLEWQAIFGFRARLDFPEH